ncbi:MAG TPA: hypothetical protein VGS27_34375 [Candidatus Sulfotelmatobacter sp.]|nr:hypothetical protein [Candidatus Sulfotelmatobacter sp.]
MKKLGVIAFLALVCELVVPAMAQQVDVAIAGGSVISANSKFSSQGLVPGQGGGTYIGFNGDVLFHGNLGVQAEVNWRASQGIYAGLFPYRPVFWDFNAIYAKRFSPRLGAEVLGGIGGESVRFYSGQYNCDYYGNCTNYVSSNHFMADFGGGLRVYVWRNAFIRPELRLYLIHNNVEFSSNYPLRYGVSLGYTFGGSH